MINKLSLTQVKQHIIETFVSNCVEHPKVKKLTPKKAEEYTKILRSSMFGFLNKLTNTEARIFYHYLELNMLDQDLCDSVCARADQLYAHINNLVSTKDINLDED